MSDHEIRLRGREPITDEGARAFRHDLARRLGPVEIEDQCRLAELRYDATMLIDLDPTTWLTASTSKINTGTAHEASVSGRWAPGPCEICDGNGWIDFRTEDLFPNEYTPVMAPLERRNCFRCLGSGARWCEGLARLGVHAGEPGLCSLLDPEGDMVRIDLGPDDDLGDRIVDWLPERSELAALAAATQVAWEWLYEVGPRPNGIEPWRESERALKALGAYVDHPTNGTLILAMNLWHGRLPNQLRFLLHYGRDLDPSRLRFTLRCCTSSLPRGRATDAACVGIRRFALGGLT